MKLRLSQLLLVALVPMIAACGASTAGPTATATATATLRPYLTETATPTQTELPGSAQTPESLLPSPTPFVHEVQAGETLLDLVLRYGVTLEGLLTANPGIDPRFISIGQAIRIPDTEGAPLESLLPTSTPVPLDLSRAACYPTLTDALWCVATVRNDGGSDLEAITAEARLLDERGQPVGRAIATSPLSRLPADGILPVAVLFEPPAPDFARVEFELLSAIGSSSDERYAEASLADVETEAQPDGEWLVRGLLDAVDEIEPAAYRAGLLAIGLDASGEIVGFTKWEPEPAAEWPYQFTVTVYSLGPVIDRVQLLAELAAIPE